MRLSEIKYATVRRYETLKLSEKDPLSPGSINKTVQLLAAILERAYREELIDRNPAKGDRLKVSKPTRAYLDHSDQIDALLRAAAALDAEARADRRGFARRAIVTTLLFTGVRVGELCSLRWRDIDLANARLRIATSKTDKGVRTIDLLPVLLGELKAHKASTRFNGPDDFVFATTKGGLQNKDNVRERVVKRAAVRASDALVEAGGAPLPPITPHACRRTFASVLVALGEDIGYVMDQMATRAPKSRSASTGRRCAATRGRRNASAPS